VRITHTMATPGSAYPLRRRIAIRSAHPGTRAVVSPQWRTTSICPGKDVA
jgi:hypothetical protein